VRRTSSVFSVSSGLMGAPAGPVKDMVAYKSNYTRASNEV
jgi:hypothetical protein